MSVKSIQDLVDFLGTECRDCRGYGDFERYEKVRKKGRKAVYSCRWWHDHERKIAFQTTPKDIKGLEKDIQELLENKPQEGAPQFEREDYLKRSDELMRKIGAYAHFAPKNLKMEINGYCHHCSAEVPITIEENKVWIGCEYCATIIADGAD